MSRSRIAIAVAVLATLIPGAALGRGHFGPVGIVRYAVARLLPFGALHRSFVLRSHIGNPYRVRDDTSSPPLARGQLVAAAALAGWHGGRTANGWWRHGDGGYGWVGPLFWPFAHDDISVYIIFGEGAGFWAYGYADVYAGIFAPYGQQDLAAYLGAAPSLRRHRRALSLQQFCGEAGERTAGAGIDQIRQAIQPNEAQRAALDELAGASLQAAEIIRASCPTETPSGAPGRLEAMQARIEAMIKAALTLRPPLGKLYDSLSDEQKERFNALSDGRRRTSDPKATSKTAGKTTSASAKSCGAGQSAALQWPTGEIEERLHPSDTQRSALDVLQDASTAAAEMLQEACEEDDTITPPARLAAVARRLDALLLAVKPVGEALEDLYATLSDEQKAQFEAIGPRRTS